MCNLFANHVNGDQCLGSLPSYSTLEISLDKEVGDFIEVLLIRDTQTFQIVYADRQTKERAKKFLFFVLKSLLTQQ